MIKRVRMFLGIILMVVAMTACGNPDSNENATVVPDDFSFSFSWDVNGNSSYDSSTGKLVKTTVATNPDDYITNYQLTEEDKIYIYNLITELDVNSYPDMYNPNNGMMSKPSMTLVLKVRMDGVEKIIQAKSINFSFVSKDSKGQKFLSVCEAIRDRLIATEEWKALPDYEYVYRSQTQVNNVSECLVEEDGKQYLILPVSNYKIRITNEYKEYIDSIDFDLLKAADEKIYSEIPLGSNQFVYSLEIEEESLCLFAEIIIDINPATGSEDGETTGCGDHVHKYFTERICK